MSSCGFGSLRFRTLNLIRLMVMVWAPHCICGLASLNHGIPSIISSFARCVRQKCWLSNRGCRSLRRHLSVIVPFMLGVPSALVTIIFLSRGRVRMPSLWAVSKFIKFSCAPVSSRAVRVTGFPFNIILIGIRRESALLLRVIALSWRGGCFNSEVIKNFRIRQSRYLRGPLHLSAKSFPCNQPHHRIHFHPMLGTLH